MIAVFSKEGDTLIAETTTTASWLAVTKNGIFIVRLMKWQNMSKQICFFLCMLFVARLNPLRLSLSLKGSFVSTSYVAPRRLLYQRPGSFDQKSRNGEHLGWPQPTPYEISQRLIAAASRGELNKAIEIVKRSAVDSQSTSVWNTLLKQVLVAERYKLSYDVFTDVRKSLLVFTTSRIYILSYR